MLREEKAQVSFDYLLTAVFAIFLAIGVAVIVEVIKGFAYDAQADLLTTRARVIDNIMR